MMSYDERQWEERNEAWDARELEFSALLKERDAKIVELSAQIEVARDQQPVCSIHKSHLKEQLEPWCKEVLMYSPNNSGDFPENRVMLYAQPVISSTAAALAKIKADTLRELATEFECMDCTLITTETIKKIAAEIEEGVAK